ncbi:hypothetical protein CLAIMM_04781 [Cladophialophora immunda]|nr:hypothetical protein CLAIMM_04781 [Cladophialophora immunda]
MRISSLEKHIADIYGRLRRLEESAQAVTVSSVRTTYPSQMGPGNECIANETNNAKQWEDLESTAASSTPSQAIALGRITIDSHDHFDVSLPDPVARRDRLERAPNPHLKSSSDVSDLICQLPTIHTARLLFDHYIQIVDCLHRELHVPSARALVEESYARLANSLEVSTDVLTFLFCIFASSSFHVCHAHIHHTPKGLIDSARWAVVWKMTASDLIFDKRAMFSTSLLSLQSVSIMLLLAWNSGGQSAEFQALKSIALQKAIQMGIYKLDAGYGAQDGNGIEMELKRRLWWHLAASDWLVASVPGLQEGIYSVNPAHARVNYPANLDDRGLGSNTSLPLGFPEDQPTSTSFLIQRVKFAELCRQLVDSLQNVAVTEKSRLCSFIRAFSDRLRHFEQGLPWFFRMDEESMDKANALSINHPYLIPQKYLLLFGIYSRIVRLHRPFLSMKLPEPDFSASRTVCIQYAEKILKLRSSIDLAEFCRCIHSYSVGQHTFGALLLLSMDSMLETDVFRAQARKAELVEICQTLKAKEISLNTSGSGIVRGIDKLTDLLRKPDLNTPGSSSSSAESAVQRNLQNLSELSSSGMKAPVIAGSHAVSSSEPGHTTLPIPISMPLFSDDGTLDEFLNQIDGMQGFNWEEAFLM